MKIAICAKEDNEKSIMDNRFGRCNYFLIFENTPEGFKFSESIKNEAQGLPSGAGLRAVEILDQAGVDKVIAMKFGPKAEKALNEMQITPIIANGENIDENIEGLNTKEKKKTIFIPLLDDAGGDSRISPHFGHAPYFAIIKEGETQPKIIKNDVDHHDPEKSPVEQIKEIANPDVVVAKKMGMRAITLFNQNNIMLKEATKDRLQDAIDEFDNLPELSQSCGH
ncbi:MAG: NifB/NifX family molybdenum-iron cluster-binding protein [Nanobdellota archaeon]